jgi:hypothetical protein
VIVESLIGLLEGIGLNEHGIGKEVRKFFEIKARRCGW